MTRHVYARHVRAPGDTTVGVAVFWCGARAEDGTVSCPPDRATCKSCLREWKAAQGQLTLPMGAGR